MKLLYWMQRKFKQNTTSEPFKDFVIGQACNFLSEQPSSEEQQHNCSLRPSKSQKQNLLLHTPFSGRLGIDEYYFDEEYSISTESGHFNGLLTIGTFGSETVMTEPETPTFPVNVWEQEADVREDELPDLNEEVFCFDEGVGDGLGSVCANQEDLFGSPILLAEVPRRTGVKKENRTSLGELFQRSKVEEVLGETEEGRGEREERGEKEGDKFIKKKHKKKLLGGSAADSAFAENKRNKVLQMFHRKVHPEGPSTRKKSSKSNKKETRNTEELGHDNQLPEEDMITYHRISVSKERIRRLKSDSPHFAIGVNVSNGNREYWIRTDAEYVVLEL